jgi:hypothetical protein
MPNQQDIQNQQLLNDQLTQTRDLSNELIGAYRDLTKESNELFRSSEEISKLRRKDKEVAKDLFKDIERSLRTQKINSENLITLESKRLGGTLRLRDVDEAISKSKAKQEALVDRINEALIENYITESQAKDLVEKITEQYQKQEVVLKRLGKQAEELEEKLGATYKIFDGISKIPILNTLVNVQKIKASMEEAATKTSSSLKLLGVGLSSTFAQLGKSLKDPLLLLGAQVTLLKKAYDLYGGIDQRVTDQAKQLGISKEQSQALYKSAADYAANQRDAFVTDSKILESRFKLNEALGTSIAFTDKEAITAERLSTFYGVSAEQNASLASLARQTGQTNEDILNTVVRTSNEQKRQFGGTLNTQKALQKVSSLSGEILTKFKGNVTAMASAVMQADRLGLTLEQVDKIGESLLNFEQSIESELKAELLTGRAINVEKARAAALSGNQVALMNEIATQVGNIHQFEKMNVIQRQAYAEAFGMGVSEMGDMLRKKDLEAKLGVDIQKSATEALRLADEKGIRVEDSIRQELEQRSLSELQKDTFLKIRDILARITSGPMKVFYGLLENALKKVESIFGFFSKMSGGGLGNALGAVLLGAPVLLGGMRLLLGTAKSIFSNGLTPMTAPWVKVANMGGGAMGGPMGGSMGSQFTGGSFSAGKQALAQRRMMRGGGFGLAAMGVGLATSAISSNMDTGAGKTAVSTVGGAASGALTGAALGSVIPVLGTAAGAIIGGLIGGVSSLVSEMQATREKEEANKVARDEAQKRTQEALEQMSIRPIELNVTNETIGKWNTYSSQNGANNSFA